MKNTMAEATFGAGCFWCYEAMFSEMKGVSSVSSGYSGGHVKNPAYREVCNGTTGHAEVIRIVFDENIISFAQLLEVFFVIHDPTTLNRQGADVGTQYRSVVFYHDDEQKRIAELAKQSLDETNEWANPIVTTVDPLRNFYPADSSHDNFYAQNTDQPYCNVVIRPKLDKFRKRFSDYLKTD